jgi:hypothetical protein
MAELPEIAPVRPAPEPPPTDDERAAQLKAMAEAIGQDLQMTRFAMLAVSRQCAGEVLGMVQRESNNIDRIGRLVEVANKALGAAEASARAACRALNRADTRVQAATQMLRDAALGKPSAAFIPAQTSTPCWMDGKRCAGHPGDTFPRCGRCGASGIEAAAAWAKGSFTDRIVAAVMGDIREGDPVAKFEPPSAAGK